MTQENTADDIEEQETAEATQAFAAFEVKREKIEFIMLMPNNGF